MIRVYIDGLIYGMQAHGGIGRCFTEIINRVAEVNEDIEFLLAPPWKTKGELPSGGRIRVLHEPSFPAVLPKSISKRIKRGLKEKYYNQLAPHVFHSTYYTPNPFPNTKTVVTVHDFIDERSFCTMSGNGADFVALKRQRIEEADAVIAVSETVRQDVMNYTDAAPEKVWVARHGINDFFRNFKPTDADVSSFRSAIKCKKPFWLFVGRRLRYKNFNTVLRAWVEFDRVFGMSTQLIAVGPDIPLEESQIDFLVRNSRESDLRILVDVSDKELATAYHEATALIFPSLFEGFGIPIIEAMASECPVIASDIPVFHEVAGNCASFFDPHSSDDLVEAMQDVWNSSIGKNLIEAGKKRQSCFTWNAASKIIAQVYRSLST